MADAATVASLATAGGTLVLALATFSSTRSSNRSARVAELALQTQLRPVLFTARYDDPPMKVSWVDDHRVVLKAGLASLEHDNGVAYLAIPLRNVGSGLAVLHGWNVPPPDAEVAPPEDVDGFRRTQLDMFVPAGDAGFWQAAVRDPEDPLHGALGSAITEGRAVAIEILYGDHQGGQRTVTRFAMVPRQDPRDEHWLWTCRPIRHWNIDRAQPR